MITDETPVAGGTADELARLVRVLHETQEQIVRLTGAEVDAVSSPSGAAYLLPEAQERLRRSELEQRAYATKLSAIIDALPAQVALLDASGTVLTVNGAWRRFAEQNGGEAGAPVGQNYLAVSEHATGETAPVAHHIAEGVRAVLTSREAYFASDYACHSPEELRWFRVIAAPIDKTSQEGAVVVHFDITDRKLAEESLRASERRLRTIFETASVCIGVISGEGRVLEANGTLLDALEVGSAVAATGSARRFVHPDDVAAFDDALRRGASGVTCELAFRIVARSGQERWMAAYLSPMRDASTGVDNVLCVARDVTDERRSAAALTAMQRRNDFILSSIGEGIHGMDLDGRILFINEAQAAWVGRSIDELLNESGHDLFHHHHADGSVYDWKDCPKYKTLADGLTRSVDDEVFFRADGTAFPVEYICAPILDDVGAITGVVVTTRDISERKAAEASLLRSEREQRELALALRAEGDRLVAAQAVAKLGSWETELATYDILASRETYRILEVDPTTFHLTRQSFLECVHPDDRDAVDAAFRCSFDKREQCTIAHRLLLPDGRVKHVVEQWQIFGGDDGRAARAVGVCQDVTEQRVAADELERSQKLLDMASRLSRMGAWAVDARDLSAIFWSDEVREIFGVPREFMPLWNDHDKRYAAGDSDALRSDVARCARFGTPIDRELQIVTGKGRTRWARVVAEAVRDPHGAIVGVQGAIQDIDDRKRLSEQLAESEERFRYVAQATSDAIWDWNLATGHVWWNSGIHTLFGYDADEVGDDLGSWSDRIHPDDRAATLASMESSLANGTFAWQHRYRFRRKDGRYAQVIDRGTAVRDASGTPVRKIGSLTDVTDQLALEEQLRQSQKLEALGQLTGGVAHDFNNLLTVILGNAELLAGQPALDERSNHMASMIGKAAQRGADLTQRLLAFARRQALEPKPADINAVVAGMVPMLERAIDEHVELLARYQPDLWAAYTDVGQLEDALLNLCINARDAMPNGGRLIVETANVRIDRAQVERYAELAVGDYVLLSITDTGVGIAPEHIARVFEPFYTTKVKGTGLGLSMVYGFMKQSGGHVSVYSEPGIGTTIKLYVPRVATGPTALPEAAPDEFPASRAERILLVEDDEMVRDYAHQQLEAFGYHVLVAASGAEALTIVREGTPFDLLFTDIVMPGGMNGIELAQEARRLRPGLQVLYTSGYADGVVSRGKLESGALLVSKPYHRIELANKIRQALDGAGIVAC